ncbi:MAG: tetratricopeptide repeat protein [Promethearchaeota archaeon]
MPEMSDQKSKRIIRIESLLTEGKREEALEKLRKYQQTTWSYLYGGAPKKGLEIALQCKDAFQKIGNQMLIAGNLLTIGHMYIGIGDNKTAVDYGLRCLELYEKNNGKGWIAAGCYLVGQAYMNTHKLDLAYKYFQKGLAIKEIAPDVKCNILISIGNVVGMRGDFSQTAIYSEKGLKIAKENKFYFACSFFLFYLGLHHFFLRNFDQAERYLNLAIDSCEKANNINIKAFSLQALTNMFLENDSIDKSKDYLNQLKNFEAETESKFVTYMYFIAKGALLIESGRTRDRAEAEMLFKQVVEDDNFAVYNIQNLISSHYAFYFLCRLYLDELGMSNDLKILDDINPLMSHLYEHAENFQSPLFLAEAKLFNAKLDLIQIKFDNAKKLLTEAQQLVETENLNLVAQMISNEHDNLLKQQELWNNLEKTNAPFSERIELAAFDGILDRIQGKPAEEPPELVPESPVFLLIITESGTPLFSYSFSSELSFEDDIVSSFISAFNAFSGELFSKGLDRARFGDYIILIETVESYSLCYLFKGQSYPAKQRLTSFIDRMQDVSSIWQTLNKFYETSQVAELKDLPQIENLIREIFIN